MTLLRAKVIWNGFNGGPGVNVLHFGQTPEQSASAGDDILAALKTFYSSLSTYLPNGVSVSFDGQLELVRDTDGRIEDIIGVTPPAPVTGAGAGNYSSGSGACIHWITSDYQNGRRVRGRSFLAPLASGAFDITGTLNNTMIAAVQTAGQTLLSNEAVQLSVYRRERQIANVIQWPGSQHRVTACRISDKGSYLTSRRE